MVTSYSSVYTRTVCPIFFLIYSYTRIKRKKIFIQFYNKVYEFFVDIKKTVGED